jgi:hypothetical protein
MAGFPVRVGGGQPQGLQYRSMDGQPQELQYRQTDGQPQGLQYRPMGGLVWLFLRQRAARWGVLTLAGLAALLFVLGDWVTNPDHPVRAVVLVLSAPAMVAIVIGISAWAPSGDLELASSFPLVWLRLVHLGGLLLVGVIASSWVVRGWDIEIAGDVSVLWVWVRNVLGVTGLTLLTARWVQPRLSWMVPCLLAVVVPVIVLRLADDPATVVNERFRPDWWVFPGQDQGSVVSWGIAVGLLVVGMMVIGFWGPKVEVEEE